MTKVTLTDVGSLIDVTSAQTTINDNSAAIVTAVENTLSRDGTSPNTMGALLDMNSNKIINLPAPIGGTEPVRLTDLSAVNGTITINALPTGGTTGQPLAKNSATNYDVSWATITGTGNFVKSTSPTITSPALVTPNLGTPSTVVLTNATGLPVSTGITGLGSGVAGFLATPTSASLATAVTDETGSGSLVFATSPTLVTPVLGTPASGNLANCTIPISQVSSLGAGMNTFLTTPSSANLRATITDETGSGGALVFATSPTITTPAIVGITNGSAVAAGNIGEYLETVVLSGAAVALTTGTPLTIATRALTAGEWDVRVVGSFLPAATTSQSQIVVSIADVTNALNTAPGRLGIITTGPFVSGGFQSQASLPPYRISLSATTSIFLVMQANFTISTMSAYGIISARRVA